VHDDWESNPDDFLTLFVFVSPQSTDHKFQPFGRTDIEITGEELNGHGSGSPSSTGLTLQVRRGSEPALNRLSPIHISPLDTSKRWSAAPIIDDEESGMMTAGKVSRSLFTVTLRCCWIELRHFHEKSLRVFDGLQ